MDPGKECPGHLRRRGMPSRTIPEAEELQEEMAALEHSEQFARSIVTWAPVGIAVADRSGRLVRVNEAMSRITGYCEEELLGRDLQSLTHPEDAAHTEDQVRRLWAGEIAMYAFEKRYVRRDGSTAHVSVSSSLLRDTGGRPSYQFGIVEDVSGREAAERRVARLAARADGSARLLEAIVDHGSDLVLVIDRTGGLTYASPPVARFLGSQPSTRVDGVDLLATVDAADLDVLLASLTEVRSAPHAVMEVQVRARRHDGRLRTFSVSLTNLDHVPAVAGVVVNARDVTDELQLRTRLDQHLVRDGLTGVANRAALLEALRERWAERTSAPFCLLLVDLVGMASVNDRVGHMAGDFLLRSTAVRIQDAAPPGAVVARTSGDEFAIILPDGDGHDALALAGRVVDVFATPFTVPGGGALKLSAHAGLARSRETTGTPNALLQDADLALVEARSSGHGAVHVCTAELRERHRRRLTLEHDLALPGLVGQLFLRYQPIVELASGRVLGVEALARWNHPQLGLVGPDEFIPIAERTGAIVPIGSWVLDQAWRQLVAWDRHGPPGLCMSVNLSARQLVDPDFPRTAKGALQRSGIDPSRLCLEVTETALIDETDVTTTTVQALLDLGLRIHVDDFGTGYSSFDELWRFRFHGLKIDRSYVAQLGKVETADVITAGILAIARTLELDVIAEGVENAEQRNALVAMGCDAGQGHLWSPPVDPDAIPDLVRTSLAMASTGAMTV